MTLPNPESRKEQYLAKAAGMDTEIPAEPMSREEEYLNAIAQGGGGGGYVLPVASASELGGVKVGANLAIDENGVLSGTASGPTVVQTTGTSTTDVMSQDAVTSMVYSDPGTCSQIHIGNSASSLGDSAIVLGWNSSGTGKNAVSIGAGSTASGQGAIAIGRSTRVSSSSAVAVGTSSVADHTEGTAIGGTAKAQGGAATALGAYSTASSIGAISFAYCNDGGAQGVVNFGPYNSSYGYDNTTYRLLTGVHNAVGAHDAVTLGQISQLITAINSACGTSILLASDGSITNANSGNNGGNNAQEDPSDPGTGGGDEPGGEPAPEDEPGPE